MILFCGRQCIALRGDSEGMETMGNARNVLSLLKHNGILHNHLHSPEMKCVTYMPPTTQNELLEVMEKQIILRDIEDEIQRTRYYSIMADEVTSHNIEQLVLCVRYVDDDNNIHEEFMRFVILARNTGKHVASAIIESLDHYGLPIENSRGQGYDEDANMSSNRVGIHALIRTPLATYIHYSGHCLNLLISNYCAMADVCNVLARLKWCYLFFQLALRQWALETHNRRECAGESKRKPLLDLCKTRWAERDSAY